MEILGEGCFLLPMNLGGGECGCMDLQWVVFGLCATLWGIFLGGGCDVGCGAGRECGRDFL